MGTPLLDLRGHGGRPALVVPGGPVLTYRELDARVAERAGTLAGPRRLVLLPVAPGSGTDPETLVDLLAVLRAGHVPLPVPDSPVAVSSLVSAYRPPLVLRRGRAETTGAAGPALHPELGLLLSTSGSTGSPKLVRLSRDNLAANTRQITGYLPVRETDRAPLMLPVSYCYGLSLVLTNLSRGAALLLTTRSAGDPGFLGELAAHGATSLHGVPHTFALLEAAGFGGGELPALRYVTQAGGRWDPAAVRRWAASGAAHGWELHVMYGATEATARMAHLPPGRAATAPGAVGVAVDGARFEVRDPGPDGVGDLVFRGPNVMLGYARRAAELALGRTVTELVTGDRGRVRPDGLVEVTGRASRTAKPFGIRVDLDRVDAALGAAGCDAAVTAPAGDVLAVVVAHGCPPARARAVVASATGLPEGALRVVAVPALPRTPAGKIDGAALARAAAPDAGSPPAPVAAGPDGAGPAGAGPGRVRAVFRSAFPGRGVRDTDSFLDLGGDSLTSIPTGTGLRRVLGPRLPRDWTTTPVGDLARLAVAAGPAHPGAGPGPGRARLRGACTPLDTPTVLRAVAIVLVVGSHIEVFRLLGGSHVLLAAAGWAFAAYAMDRPGGAARPLLRTATAIAVPTALWIAARAPFQPDLDLVNAALVNYVVDPQTWGYWFVETLVWILLGAAAVFAVPAVRRFERARPWACAALALVPAAALLLVDEGRNEFGLRLMSVPTVLWVFVLGWMAHRATTPGRRLTVVAAVTVFVPVVFGDEPWRGTVVAAGIVLLLVPALPVPTALVRPLALVGGASLAIYLTHYAVFPLVGAGPVALVTCLLAGIAAERARRHGEALATRLARRATGGSRRATGPPPRQRRALAARRCTAGPAPAPSGSGIGPAHSTGR